MAPPITIPARHGKAVRLRASQSFKIINMHGTQIVDTWAFTLSPTSPPICLQYLSMQHTHASLSNIIPEVGDTLTSNERKGMLTVTEDTSGSVHDTLIAACDTFRYQELGATGYHENCADNLIEGLNDMVENFSFSPVGFLLFRLVVPQISFHRSQNWVTSSSCGCKKTKLDP